MSSALAAFAKSQSAARLEPAPSEVVEEDGYTSGDDSKPVEQELPAGKNPPTALADFAQSQQRPTNKKPVTLVEIAQEQCHEKPKPSLVDVARTLDNQSEQATSATLSVLAAQVQREEREAAQRRTQQIERELDHASREVKQEHEAVRHAQVTQALRAATNQEDHDQAYDAQGDAFEADDATVDRAAERVVDATTRRADKPSATALSVDRQLLKQRAQRRGLETTSTGKAKTLKDKLSAFQFDQLSLTQQRVFLAMLVDDTNGPKPKRCNMHVIEALATDRATQLRDKHKLLKQRAPQFAKLDDARHCRFKPKIKAVDNGRGRRGGDDDDDDDDSGRRDDFIRRMEATERVRNEQLRRTRAERDYLAQIDKKECPQCGNPQSYAELTQKRKKCPNCGVTYKSRLAWGEIADEFLARMASHLKSHDLDREESDNQRSESPSSGPTLRWRDVREEFLGRVQLDLAQRAMTKELILQELEAQCTFTPQISARARRLELGDFDERLRRDLENRRIRQEQYRILSVAMARAEASGNHSDPTRKQPTATTKKPAGLARSFEARLQQDIAKRRERLAANDTPQVRRRLMNSGMQGRSRGLY